MKRKPLERLQPFVSPYVTRLSSADKMKMEMNMTTPTSIPMQIDLTPRMMAYFEVSILSRDAHPEINAEASNEDGRGRPSVSLGGTGQGPLPPHLQRIGQRPLVPSCIAVGLSTDGFQASVRMPGWDAYSYGYHGDDGGIFHSQGEMIRVYGPKYGVGDTVGCGVNYQNGGIFYTLNGNFLGYAWMEERIVMEAAGTGSGSTLASLAGSGRSNSKKVNLYPTVGVDSLDLIGCNFGNERPFVFNFAGFVANGGSMPI